MDFENYQFTTMPGGMYTCDGKGGIYEDLGLTTGAGTSKGLPQFRAYRDVTTGRVYLRTPDDFDNRLKEVQ